MEDLIRQLKPDSSIRLFKKGSNVLFQGEIPRHVMIVRDGLIRAYTITSMGEERTVALYGKGDIFPLSWVLGETSNALFYYDAVSEARVLCAPKDKFERIMVSSLELISVILNSVAKTYTALLLRINGLEQSRAVEKIGFTLYYLLFRFGVEKHPGVYLVDIKLSQLMISTLVGLTRESTSTNLKFLKNKGIIDYTSSTYTINKTKLENFLGEDGFRDLTL